MRTDTMRHTASSTTTSAKPRSTGPDDLTLSAADETALCILARQGDTAARERLILGNLRLVRIIARSFEGRGLPTEDLVAEGVIGLMRAVDRHDPGRDTRLTTFAGILIKQHMQRGLELQSRTVRLPGNVLEKQRRIERIADLLAAGRGGRPSEAELAAATGICPLKLAAIIELGRGPIHLDQPTGEGEDTTLHDVVSDRDTRRAIPNPAEVAVARDLRTNLLRLLAKLEFRERRILLERFGFNDGREKTLDELSRVFGVTRERIRQIQTMAMGKLRVALSA